MLLGFLAHILKRICEKMRQENQHQMLPQHITCFEGLIRAASSVDHGATHTFFLKNKGIKSCFNKHAMFSV